MPRECIFRSDQEWARIRARYETASPPLGLRSIAKEYSISPSTVMKRAWREKWQQSQLQVASARRIVAAATDKALTEAAESAAQQVASSMIEQLQPWIEQEKVEHIKKQVERSKRNLDRLDNYVAKGELLGPKDESHYAKSIDIFDSITRRTLGMNESDGANGALSVRVLTQGCAIQVQAG